MADRGLILYILDCCAPHRYDSAIIESIIAMILIDILDAIVRYRIDNDGDKNLGKIQIELRLELSTETLSLVEYLTPYSSICKFYFKSLKSAVSTVE